MAFKCCFINGLVVALGILVFLWPHPVSNRGIVLLIGYIINNRLYSFIYLYLFDKKGRGLSTIDKYYKFFGNAQKTQATTKYQNIGNYRNQQRWRGNDWNRMRHRQNRGNYGNYQSWVGERLSGEVAGFGPLTHQGSERK